MGTLTPISSGLESSWTMRTSSRQRGGWPKCSIQLRRAAARKARSVFFSTKLRAAAIDCGWSSGSTPRAIGIAR